MNNRYIFYIKILLSILMILYFFCLDLYRNRKQYFKKRNKNRVKTENFFNSRKALCKILIFVNCSLS